MLLLAPAGASLDAMSSPGSCTSAADVALPSAHVNTCSEYPFKCLEGTQGAADGEEDHLMLCKEASPSAHMRRASSSD